MPTVRRAVGWAFWGAVGGRLRHYSVVTQIDDSYELWDWRFYFA